MDKASSCTSYIPSGATDAIKAAICNSLVYNDSGDKKCTYLPGNNNCINSVAACAYTKPATATTDALA